MADLLLKDRFSKRTEMEVTDKQAQEEYERFVADAAEKRVADSKSITDKNVVLENSTECPTATIHGECS